MTVPDNIIKYEDVEITIYIIKMIIIAFISYYTNFVILGIKNDEIKNRKIQYVFVVIAGVFCGLLKYKTDYYIATMGLIMLLAAIFTKMSRKSFRLFNLNNDDIT